MKSQLSTLYLEKMCECTSNLRLLMSNPLFLTPLGGTVESSTPDLSRGVIDVPVKFQLCILKTVRMHVEFKIFE